MHNAENPFVWTVWVLLSQANLDRAVRLWNDARRAEQPPYFGWLSTTLTGYPETVNLATNVHTRAVGLRPSVELEPTNHPLAVEQREGITVERVQQLAAMILHPAR